MTYNPTPAEFLAGKSPCRAGRNFALKFETMSQVWEACERSRWMFWILEHTTPLTKEQSVRLANAFAEPRLGYIPEGEVEPREAIEAAKKWLEDPTEENRIAADAAYDAAAIAAAINAADDDAAYAARDAAVSAADAAAYAGVSVAATAAYAAVSAAYAADSAADAAASAARAADVGSAKAAHAAANREHCETIRAMVANPFS